MPTQEQFEEMIKAKQKGMLEAADDLEQKLLMEAERAKMSDAQAQRELELFLIDAVAELETTGGDMTKMSWQYEEGVLINGYQAKLILRLLRKTELWR